MTITVDETKQLLRRIATHLHHLQGELYDYSLQATRYSQTDSHKSHGGPSEPLDIIALDYIEETVTPVVKGWCYSLANSHQARGIPEDQPLTIWCAWLTRYTPLLLTADYAEQAVEELQELEAELRSHIHPQEPHEIKLPDYATVDEIAQALGKTAAAVRKWCERKQVTKYIQGGLVHYRTAEIDR